MSIRIRYDRETGEPIIYGQYVPPEEMEGVLQRIEESETDRLITLYEENKNE